MEDGIYVCMASESQLQRMLDVRPSRFLHYSENEGKTGLPVDTVHRVGVLIKFYQLLSSYSDISG